MKLCIKQEIFSLKDRFYVMDAAGRNVYYVESEFFTFFKKFHVFDMGGTEQAYIEQNFSFLEPELSVYIDGQEEARIVKKLTFFTPEYDVDGPEWKVQGDFFGHDYEITQDGQVIASINKEWFTWGDCYSLDVAYPGDTMLALSVMLAIDFALSCNN